MNPQSNKPNLGVINVPQQPHKKVFRLTDLQARLAIYMPVFQLRLAIHQVTHAINF